MEAYNPIAYPQIMKMQLKHTLHQKPSKGSTYVPLPESIVHRLGGSGQYSPIENIGWHLSEMSSTVLEKSDLLTKEDKDKAAVKWVAEVEVSIISAIIAAPKEQSRCWTRRQEHEMISVLAKVLAEKMVELAEVARISADAENIFTVTWGGDVMKVALEMFRDSIWRQHSGIRSEYGPG